MAKSRKKHKLVNDEDCRKNRSSKNSKEKKRDKSRRNNINNANNQCNGNNSNTTNTNNGLSEIDLKNLELLETQKYAMIIILYSDYLYYKTTLEAIDLTANKNERTAQEQQDFTVHIDREVVTAVRLTLLTRLMFLKIALETYDIVYNQTDNKEYFRTLAANELVIKSLMLKVVGDTYSLKAAIEFLSIDGASFFGL